MPPHDPPTSSPGPSRPSASASRRRRGRGPGHAWFTSKSVLGARLVVGGAVLALAVGVGASAASCIGEDPGPGPRPAAGPTATVAPPKPPAVDCSMPRPGCACADEGLKVVCGEAVSEVAGQKVCGKGVSVCADEEWGECVINSSVTLAVGTTFKALGDSETCDNPCDPYCYQYNDDAEGLADSDAGILEGDGGITLGNTPTPWGGGPCLGGTSGACAHTICEPGAALALGCDAAPDVPAPVPGTLQSIFSEPFANNNQSWALDTGWAIGSATASSNHQTGYADPSQDTTAGSNNGVAGVVIGGNSTTSNTDWRYLTSRVINTSAYAPPFTLRYQRWLNAGSSSWMHISVQVFNGTGWVTLYNGNPNDNSWQLIQHDVTAYANPAFRVRFGYNVDSGGLRVSNWNLDDVAVTGFSAAAAPPPTLGGSCVSQVCAADPTCCTTEWSEGCVEKVASVCNVECMCGPGSVWYGCYDDDFDHDGDGYVGTDGDCADCDVERNAGAFDVPANGLDDDCNGTIDDLIQVCDTGLPLSTLDPMMHARAIDICQVTTDGLVGAAKTWGVYGSGSLLVQADAITAPALLSHGIVGGFGTGMCSGAGCNAPRRGASMAMYSSGTARAPGHPGYVNPNGQVSSYNAAQSAAYPPGFPVNAAGCPGGVGLANDSAGLKLRIRVPTNARSFTYNFNFFSSEYPEWVCTAYNDHFVALLTSGAAGIPADKNISFDLNGDPVSVNIAFFTVPGCPTCLDPALNGTGFDGTCDGQICGGATDWLFTSAPVVPGEDMVLHFSTWDMSDHQWDSTVLLDNFTWSADDSTVFTGDTPVEPPTEYAPGTFVRDYDATGVCPVGSGIVWAHWSWTSSTPGDSLIRFSVATADSAAGLDAATLVPLRFSNPPGPVGLAGTSVIARSGPPDTQVGAAVVDTTLAASALPRSHSHLRVVSELFPTTDLSQAPTLQSWNMQFDCIPNQ